MQMEAITRRQLIRYDFRNDVDLEYVQAELRLAMFNVESLHGPARARLEANHVLDGVRRVLLIDATTEVGENLNRLFVGGLLREHGPESFVVQRVNGRLPSRHKGKRHAT